MAGANGGTGSGAGTDGGIIFAVAGLGAGVEVPKANGLLFAGDKSGRGATGAIETDWVARAGIVTKQNAKRFLNVKAKKDLRLIGKYY